MTHPPPGPPALTQAAYLWSIQLMLSRDSTGNSTCSSSLARGARLVLRCLLGGLFVTGLPSVLFAGGSGLNVAVVLNQASSNSITLGNYYCERRQVPPQNVLRINWTGGSIVWTRTQFESVLLNPLAAMLAERGLAGQVDYVVLSMDMPYRVASNNGINSTTSALFYGFKQDDPPGPDVCVLASSSTNLYAWSESAFRRSPVGTNANTFLATMLTGTTLADAQRLVDQGVNSDGTFPTPPVLLEKTSDPARNVRFFSFDNAIFDLRLNGRFPLVRTNSNQTTGLSNLLGLQTGLAGFSIDPNAFVPGALADSLTSFGGCLFDNFGQTTLLAFVGAGAAGSYGAVTEPCNFLEKFPDPIDYFYLARGFSLAECYYQSILNPYQGLIVAEPLAAPFALPGSGRWVGLASNAVLSGTTELALEFQAADAQHPLEQVDLFLDGLKLQTLTNLLPAQSNILTVALPGLTTNYTVPADASLDSIAADLAAAINAQTNVTQVEAFAYGDRLELESMDPARTGPQTSLSAESATGGTAALTTFVSATRPQFLDSVARGWRFWQVTGNSITGDYLQMNITKTNGENLSLAVTNSSPPINAVQLTQQLLGLINATPTLQGLDGMSAEDTYPDNGTNIYFLVYARTSGLPAAQIQVQLLASTNLVVSPTNMSILGDNLTDLQPRNHLQLTVGVTNLAFSFPLDTTLLPDGWHELLAVAYQGSSVRTQTRAAQAVRIQNIPLTATLTGNTVNGFAQLSDLLQFTVTANTADIASIELFGTGGSLGVVTNRQTADFSVAAATLGLGLHPFTAVVRDRSGHQYRTETQRVRLVERAALERFSVHISTSPLILSWPVFGGHTFEVLAGDSLDAGFLAVASLTATNTGVLQWQEPETNAPQRFYQVRSVP